MGTKVRILIALSALLEVCGCTDKLAKMVVQSPNLGYPPQRRVDATAQELADLCVDQQLRIPVGPPDATLSVWINAPSAAPASLKFESKQGFRVLQMTRQPVTQPTTQRAPRGTVFILTGIETDKDTLPYLQWREMLSRAGYQTVLLDQRGQGRSTGRWITYGAVESHDMVQVLDRLRADGLAPGEVGVIGISYGASVAIEWAAIDPRVKAIVALEPFCSLTDVAVDAAPFILGKWKWFFSDDDIRSAVTRAGRMAGFNPADASPIDAIKKTSVPILLIHSRSDELIPVSHSQRLHDAAPEHTELILVDGQSHFFMWYTSAELIRARTLTWFGKYVAPPRQPPSVVRAED
jgi:pimeloyl-ACP methyl ester carboxylesterase